LLRAALESKVAPIYNPPARPQRPFEADYRGATDAPGRPLEFDIEGRPLVAEHIVGRQVVGGADVALSPTRFDAVTEAAIGNRPQGVSREALPRDAAATYELKRGPDGLVRGILFDKNISEQNYPKVVAHEMGHMIDDLAGKFVHFDKTGPIRDVVNSDPRLSKIIQFNAIPGLAVAGAAYKFIPVERDPFADEQTK